MENTSHDIFVTNGFDDCCDLRKTAMKRIGHSPAFCSVLYISALKRSPQASTDTTEVVNNRKEET